MKLVIQPLSEMISFDGNKNGNEDNANAEEHFDHAFLSGIIHVFLFYTRADGQRIVGCKIETTGLTLFVKSCYFPERCEGENPNCFLNDLLKENTSAKPQ